LTDNGMDNAVSETKKKERVGVEMRLLIFVLLHAGAQTLL